MVESRSAGRVIPDLVIIGAAKAGTTSLAARLGLHPSIYLSPVKEPEYFSHDRNWERGMAWYQEHFSDAGPDQLCLEASTAYTRSPQFPNAARRLYETNPDARLIYLMCHPVERAYSHYVHRRIKELYPGQPIDRSFEEHIVEDPLCLDSSDYKLQIEGYLTYFPRDALLLLFTHELEVNEADVLRRVCEFAELSYRAEYFAAGGGKSNVAANHRESLVRVQVTDRIKSIPILGRLPYLFPRSIRQWAYRCLRKLGAGAGLAGKFEPPPMHAETRRRLLRRYAESNAWVSRLAGMDLSDWNR